jgi:hypothetical protein
VIWLDVTELLFGTLLLKILSSPNCHFCQQRAVTPYPASSNSKKVHQTAITICRGLSHPTGWSWAALPSENISQRFFEGRETLWGYKWQFILDE